VHGMVAWSTFHSAPATGGHTYFPIVLEEDGATFLKTQSTPIHTGVAEHALQSRISHPWVLFAARIFRSTRQPTCSVPSAELCAMTIQAASTTRLNTRCAGMTTATISILSLRRLAVIQNAVRISQTILLASMVSMSAEPNA
jgi:hypothetical protein